LILMSNIIFSIKIVKLTCHTNYHKYILSLCMSWMSIF
jgi:hypothetical protein